MNKINITIQPTRNPAIIKFEANDFISNHRNYEYANIDEAKHSPLAQQLFYLPFVRTVYISGNFIAIEKYDIVTWEEVQQEVAEQIENYINSEQPVVLETEVSEKIPATVYAESTPNPAAMKFVASRKLVVSPFECKNAEDTKGSALAQALFRFPFVKELFFDGNYIAVIKHNTTDWNDITAELRTCISNFIADGKAIVSPEALNAATKTSSAPADTQKQLNETSRQIISILEEYVKPAVAGDGGNIVFESYDEEAKAVKVILQGACSGCPSSTFTLKNGIENMLKHMLQDKVNEVIAVNG